MKTVREFLPATLKAASNSSPKRASTPQYAIRTIATAARRRPQTQIACNSCRRRKSKCDGLRPACSLCAGKGRTTCEYDAGPDVTRFAALKSKHEELQRRLALLEELFRLLFTRSYGESIEIIRRMRATDMEIDFENLVKFIRNGDMLVHLASTQSKQKPSLSGGPN
ncbi:nitrogen assimilation transcription factor NIRA [Colletotrichum tofieldiae]|uniref:Nitrogen assimilation transcription factor NIRA n=1 Tax=Colletotrichum tofieldiae TaxID=708197 RepID=A0A166W358_9PEZI|nr:nitrogen assimilation transcription factor NIRA [Colletotrichum tofieldiae]